MCVCSKKGLRDITMEIGYASGVRGYFRGVKSSIANAMISNALGFTAYELAVAKYKRWSGDHSPTPTIKGVCAGNRSKLSEVKALTSLARMQMENREGRTRYCACSYISYCAGDSCCKLLLFNGTSDAMAFARQRDKTSAFEDCFPHQMFHSN